MGAEKQKGNKMKNIILIFIISMMVMNCIPPRTSALQNSDLKMPFNMEEFDKRFNFANDLARDDMVAWWTTDSITAHKPVLLDSLDKTWFVYEDNSKRYAFYGRYQEDTKEYVSKYSFMVNKKGTVNQIANDVNGTTRKYAEAIATGKKKFDKY
jgi:hypothetical protein